MSTLFHLVSTLLTGFCHDIHVTHDNSIIPWGKLVYPVGDDVPCGMESKASAVLLLGKSQDLSRAARSRLDFV